MPFYNIMFRNEKYRIKTERTVEGKENETEEELAKRVNLAGWTVVEGSKREVAVKGGR